MSTKNGTDTLTDFKRDTARFLKRLRRTGKPVVLTINGKAGLVVQDAESYRELLQRLDHLETIAAIKEGLEDIAAGRMRPAKEVLDDIESALELAMRAKIIGCAKSLPSDLSSNVDHFEGFGQ